MKKIICQVALAAALVSLAGCGLKGPLYFPPEKQPAKPQQTAVSQFPERSAERNSKGVNGVQASQ